MTRRGFPLVPVAWRLMLVAMLMLYFASDLGRLGTPVAAGNSQLSTLASQGAASHTFDLLALAEMGHIA